MPLFDINEIQAKQILSQNWNSELNLKTISIDADNKTTLNDLNSLSDNLVLKPDMLFGKRYKNGLVFIGLCKKDVIKKIKQLSTKITKLQSGHTGYLTKFIVEDNCILPNKIEHYLSIEMLSNGDKISYSTIGGVNIEDNLTSINSIIVNNVEQIVGITKDPKVLEFIKTIYRIYSGTGMMEIELNPFIIDKNDVYLLDCVTKLDSYSLTTNKILNKINIEPVAFGQKIKTEDELSIIELDKNSGSSLKYQILNKNGRIWGLYSGGGASLALLDTITDLCGFDNVANYGEYSGNPTFNEVYNYTNIVLNSISKTDHNKTNYLVIAGAIANFTNIKITLEAIAKAIMDNVHNLDYSKIKVFLRRGGPNYKQGINTLKLACNSVNIPIIAYGPETGLCIIINDLKKEFK